jgi:hypothetical protein
MGAVLDLVKVLYEPTAVFQRVREKPQFLWPFLGLAVAQALLAFLAIPYAQAAMHAVVAQLPQGANAPDPGKLAFLGVILAPIGLVLALLISTVLLWVLVSLVGGEAKFATLLSITTYAAATSVLLAVAGVAVLMLKGVGNVTSPADLQPALGLDLLVPDAGRFLTALLKSVNPFTIGGVVLTAIGIQTALNTPRKAAYTAATVAFLIGSVIAASFSLLGPGGGPASR